MIYPAIHKLVQAVRSKDHLGFCLTCGAEAPQTPPEARRAHCPVCTSDMVFGAEELLIMLKISVS